MPRSSRGHLNPAHGRVNLDAVVGDCTVVFPPACPVDAERLNSIWGRRPTVTDVSLSLDGGNNHMQGIEYTHG